MTPENAELPTPVTQETQTPEQIELAQLKLDIAVAYADIDELSGIVLSKMPDGLKSLIPDALSPVEQVKWFNKAQGAGLLARTTVPETDTAKPSLLAPKIDPSDLPPIARMSYGYGNK